MEWIVGIVVLVLDIYAIFSVLTSGASAERKLLWTVVIILLPLVGMVLYFVIAHEASRRRSA